MSAPGTVVRETRAAGGLRPLWLLIRSDRAFHAAPWWGMAGVVMGWIMLAPGFAQGSPPLVFMLWTWGISMLLSARASSRCELFALGLPLAPRRLVAARVISLALLLATFLATTTTTVALGRGLGREAGSWSAPEARLLFLFAAGYLLVLALVQSRSPARQEASRGWLVSMLAVALGGGLLLPLAMPWTGSPWLAAGLAGLALVLLVLTHLELPASFLALPTRPSRTGRGHGSEKALDAQPRWSGRAPSGRSPVTLSVLTIGYHHWFSLVAFPLLLFFGAWRAGYLAGGLHGPALTVMTLGMLFALCRIALLQLARLDHLPVARRRLFSLVALPGVLTLAAGIFAGAFVAKGLSQVTLVEFGTKRCDPRLDVRVPFEFWEIQWKGEEPLPATGDGLPCAAARARLFRWGDVVLFNPYHVPPGSPTSVAAEALSRAAAAVYGVEIPPREIEERYLRTASDGGTALRQGPFRLEEDHPGLRPRTWLRTAPVHVAALAGFWFLWLAAAMALFAPWKPGIHRLGHLVALSFLFLAVLLPMTLVISGATTEWKLSAFLTILLRSAAERIPLPTALLPFAALVVVAGAYRLASSRFEKLELTPPRGEQW